MDEQTKLLMEVKGMVAAQTEKLIAVDRKLDTHIQNDTRKFDDLYSRHREHDKFQARVKGGAATIGGFGVLAGLVATVVGFFK